MKSIKQPVKIALDIVMTILFVFLVFGIGTSIFFHEVIGIGIFVLYILHLILNGKWIKKSFSEFKSGEISNKNRILFILDLILMICMIIILITGVLISRVLFYFEIIDDLTVSIAIHDYASYISLAVLGLHIGIHLEYFVLSIKKLFTRENKKVLSGIVAVCAAMAIIYCQVYSAYMGNLGISTKVETEISETVTEEIETTTEATTTKSEATNDATTTTTTKKDEDNTTTKKATTTTTTAATVAQTLNQYLGSLHCTGCSRHCSLLSPQCNVGVKQASVATQTYNSEYASEN